jgi:hypothetical protein
MSSGAPGNEFVLASDGQKPYVRGLRGIGQIERCAED